jgi:uncharacterized protein involved in copper resistance
MFRRRRPLLPLPLRVFVLAMFALGLVSQPVIAALGDLHELAHEAAAAHAALVHTDHADHSHVDRADVDHADHVHTAHADVDHADQADSVDADLTAAGDSGHAPAGTLHLLMHHAHCCGQSAMTALSAVGLVLATPNGSRPALPGSQRLLQAPSFAPFRPPITA